MSKSKVVPLLRRDGDQRQFLGAAGICQREEEHDDRERALGLQVPIVNPEPVVAVTHGGEGIRGLVLAAVNPRVLPTALRCGGVFKGGPRAPGDQECPQTS